MHTCIVLHWVSNILDLMAPGRISTKILQKTQYRLNVKEPHKIDFIEMLIDCSKNYPLQKPLQKATKTLGPQGK